MKMLEATQVLPAPAWEDPRAHLLDDIWLLTIFAILLGVGVPWFVTSYDIEIGAALIGLLVLAGIHVAFTALAAPHRTASPWRTRALTGLHVIGVVVVGLVWQHTGGLQNPLFLLVFALPVVGAIFLSRWQPYLMATVAVLVVTAVALNQAPELRWYASGLNTAGAWLATAFGGQGGATTPPFPGFYAPSGYFVVLLEAFAILLFSCAFAAEYLGTVFDRLYSQVAVARAEAERGQELWATLIENLPMPALLVDAGTLQVMCVSASAGDFCSSDAVDKGRTLVESVRFSYPDLVEDLIGGSGGRLHGIVIHVGEQLRVADVRVQHVAHRGRRFALILIEDTTESFGIRTALDASEHAALVVDSRGTVVAFNKPALGLFSGVRIGAEVTRLFAQPSASGHWWEPGLSGRRKMHMRIAPRIYQVTSSAVTLPGEDERIFVVAFLPVVRADADPTLIRAAMSGPAANTVVQQP
jgi:hypothetical protein